MKRLALALLAFAATPAMAAEKFAFDTEHSYIRFVISHLGYSDMEGRLTGFTGNFFFDQEHPENSSVNVVISPAKVDTVSKKLDEHLQGTDWFNTAKFPEIRFTSTGIRKTGPADADITGDLTLLGVTKPVTLKAHFNKADYRMIDNQYIAGFSANTIITRSDFGMKNYVPYVGDEVRIHIEVEGVSQSPDRKPGKATTNH